MCGDLIDVGACLDIFHKVSSKSKTWQSNLTIYSKLAWTILSCDSAVAVCLWHKSFLLKAGCIFSKKVPCYSEYSFKCQRYPWGLSRSAWALAYFLDGQCTRSSLYFKVLLVRDEAFRESLRCLFSVVIYQWTRILRAAPWALQKTDPGNKQNSFMLYREKSSHLRLFVGRLTGVCCLWRLLNFYTVLVKHLTEGPLTWSFLNMQHCHLVAKVLSDWKCLKIKWTPVV